MAGRELRSSPEEDMNMEEMGLEEEEEEGSSTDDSEEDPTFEAIEQTRSKLSKISLQKSRPQASEGKEISQLNDKEKKCFEAVEKIIKDGKLDKLKIDECKIYLRKYGLRLTGNKAILQARIKEHFEVMEGGGEKKYPVSSFVLNCKGDACMGDVVMFEQNVYDMFSIVSRSATAPPCGTRTVAGRIVKESYGAAKQQHTFTVEVLWSKGEKPLPPLHPLLIKGRNLYKLKIMRQRWDDEEERKKVLQEKHNRGCIARSSRETRILEKEMKKMTRGKRHHDLLSEKPIAAGAQSTRHQAYVPEKRIAAEGQRNALHHQEQENCSDRPQRTQNSSSAQVMQPQASITALPPAEKRNYQDQNAPMILGKTIHQRPYVSVCNTLDQNIHNQSAYLRSEKPMGIGQDRTFHHSDNRNQFKPHTHCYASTMDLHQHRHQFHASHGGRFPDRRPLRNLNSASIWGPPPQGKHVHSDHQDGFFDTRPQRNLNSPSRLGSQPHRYHHVQCQPCRLYQQGRCWYGDNCKYLH